MKGNANHLCAGMAGAGLSRREALALAGAGGLALGAPGIAGAAGYGRPWLYTPDQLQAERMLLKLEADPEVKAIQRRLRDELSASPRGRIPDAAATLDRALEQWTRSLIVAEINRRPARPFFVWGTDDTPREWLGHKLGGVGTSGDNPDAIYRTAGIEGGGRYEVTGRFHPSGPPTQLLIEVNRGDMTQPQKIMMVTAGKHEDIHNSAFMSDRDLVVGRDGTFRITMGPDDGAG